MRESRKLQIGVVGSAGGEEYPLGGGASETILKAAEEIGVLLASAGAVVVTGGKGGVMEAAARGANQRGGLTVGVVKGTVRFQSNSFTDVEVLTGMEASGLDEVFLVNMCDALIVVGGGAGTLQEIVLAYRQRKPIILLVGSGGWSDRLEEDYLDARRTTKIERAATPETAVQRILKLTSIS